MNTVNSGRSVNNGRNAVNVNSSEQCEHWDNVNTGYSAGSVCTAYSVSSVNSGVATGGS